MKIRIFALENKEIRTGSSIRQKQKHYVKTNSFLFHVPLIAAKTKLFCGPDGKVQKADFHF